MLGSNLLGSNLKTLSSFLGQKAHRDQRPKYCFLSSPLHTPVTSERRERWVSGLQFLLCSSPIVRQLVADCIPRAGPSLATLATAFLANFIQGQTVLLWKKFCKDVKGSERHQRDLTILFTIKETQIYLFLAPLNWSFTLHYLFPPTRFLLLEAAWHP